MELFRLIHRRPISLELSPDQEYVVIHNPDTFLNNGFTVTVDESRPLGSRVSLTSLPASKQYTFTVTDFMELVGLVMESGGVMTAQAREVAGESGVSHVGDGGRHAELYQDGECRKWGGNLGTDCEVSRRARSSLVLSTWVGMKEECEVDDRRCVIWFR